MLRLRAYFDAAGHPTDQHLLAVGGFLSSVPAWMRFEKRWKRLLRSAEIMIPIHMADFMAFRRGFENWRGREGEQAALLLNLAAITKKHVRHSFSTIIRLDAWRQVNQVYALKESRCTPYGLCGFFTMDKTFRWLKRRTRRFQAQFIFEDGDLNKGDFIWFMDDFIGKDKKLLAGAKPNFASKNVIPLQTADFVLWEQLKLAKNYLRNPNAPAQLRESFKVLESNPNTWGVINEGHLIRFCTEFQVPKRGEKRVWSAFRS
jgi:hypothetical protein